MSSGYTSYPPYGSAPMPIHNKNQNSGHITNLHGAIGRMPASPPEAPRSVTTSGVPSYAPSSVNSHNEYQSTVPTASMDLYEYMNDRMATAYDPIPLDRSLVQQAQTSGELNAKNRELMELQALARSRLSSAKLNFADGMKAAKEVQRDLQWTQKRVSAINDRAARKYPKEYQMASQRIPGPLDE